MPKPADLDEIRGNYAVVAVGRLAPGHAKGKKTNETDATLRESRNDVIAREGGEGERKRFQTNAKGRGQNRNGKTRLKKDGQWPG